MATGAIKKVVAEKGFGFIAADDGKEYFFHHTGLDRSLTFDQLVGGERVASVREAESSPAMVIQPLAEKLRGAREQMDDIARRRGKTPSATHIVTIQGDGDIEFRVLQKVMYTLNQGGFPDIALAVLKKA